MFFSAITASGALMCLVDNAIDKKVSGVSVFVLIVGLVGAILYLMHYALTGIAL